MSDLTTTAIHQLAPYIELCKKFPKGERAPELDWVGEKEIELIYNDWRGVKHAIAGCDSCIEEALERLYNEAMLSKYE